MSYSEEYSEEEIEDIIEEKNFIINEENIKKEENFLKDEEYAEEIFLKLKNYCDFHGLDFLNNPKNICVSNLVYLIKY